MWWRRVSDGRIVSATQAMCEDGRAVYVWRLVGPRAPLVVSEASVFELKHVRLPQEGRAPYTRHGSKVGA